MNINTWQIQVEQCQEHCTAAWCVSQVCLHKIHTWHQVPRTLSSTQTRYIQQYTSTRYIWVKYDLEYNMSYERLTAVIAVVTKRFDGGEETFGPSGETYIYDTLINK